MGFLNNLTISVPVVYVVSNFTNQVKDAHKATLVVADTCDIVGMYGIHKMLTLCENTFYERSHFINQKRRFLSVLNKMKKECN